MGLVDLGIVLVLAAAALLCSGYRKRQFRGLSQKEHPIRLFYPLAAKLIDAVKAHTKRQRHPAAEALLKSLYVKENVEEEVYLFEVRRLAMILTVLFAVSMIGCFLSLASAGEEAVTSLSRRAPGQGTETYTLEVEYQGNTEELELPVEEAKYSRSELLKKMDAAMEEIRKELLGANESADAVSQPLSFPSRYDQMEISWDIDAPELLDYSGQIRAELLEGESRKVRLTATLQQDDVSKTYEVPIRLAAPKASDKEALLSGIIEAINAQENAQAEQVQLPETINGNKVTFRKPREDRRGTLLLLCLLAIGAIAFLSEKGLEAQVKNRKEELMRDFPELVSKLNLLHEAGSSIRMAFERIVADQEKKKEMRFAYQEMKLALEKIRNGVSEKEAYAEFGRRCGLHPYIKLGNLLEQNLSKGTKGMKLQLSREVAEALEERKRLARKKGEEAGTKLLLPMVLMLVVVVVIVAVPALMSMRL